jgi:D-alanyl-D-alanine carboxypeptidase/D-alanyl-D-alanine-endopeptidase (penicillin-binding protein 4)
MFIDSRPSSRRLRILAAAGAVVLSLTAALLVASCASRGAASRSSQHPPAAEGIRPHSPIQALEADLRPLFMAPEFEHAHLGVLVRSLLTGETICALNERRMMVPASNQKLLTVAAAAQKLGWDFRYTTRVLATGTLGPDGTLDGNLIVVGSGDPTINPRHAERWSALDDWAAQIAARGVRVVGGHLIGDDNAFAEPGWGSGWSWDDLVADYGSPIGALQYHENEVELLIGPGLESGKPAVIASAPFGHGLLVDNQVTTAAADQATRLSIDRAPGTIVVAVRGQVALGAKAVRRLVAVENPTRLFVNAFREALSRKGIFVGGSALDIDELREPPDLAGAETWVTDRSAPLYEIVDPLQKWSRNGYAETLLWTMSAPGAPASEAAGLTTLRETLTSLGVDASLYRAFDGSGLSRYDMVSPEALVRLLTTIWNDPALVGPYRAALPVAGVAGSLADQMKGTPAEGRVWAKTGSMFNIRSLSGYVLTADNEPLAFSFLANNYTVPSAEIEALYDKALARMAAFRR